jgi:hypothetical protein
MNMNKVDRTGTYRFDKVLESGVSITKTSNYPSFNVRLRLSEYYDEENEVWVDWSEAEVEISCYFCLFGIAKKTKKIEPTLNHQQVMKVFNWEGKSFQILANGDYSKIKGQIRIEDNDPEYADKNPFQVAFIDVFDADPSSQLRKLNPKELKDLDAQFAQLLQTSGKAPKAATVPPKKSTRPVPPKASSKPKTEAQEEPAPPTEEEKKAALKAKSEKNRAAKKKDNKPKPPARQPATPPAAEIPSTKEYTKQQAWEIVVEMKADSCDDDQLNSSWNAAINDVVGKTPDEEITGQQWGVITDKVLDDVGKF